MGSSRRSAAQKVVWANLTDEARSERLNKGRATYAANYPWRVAFMDDLRARIAAGVVLPQPCDRCGSDAAPLISWGNVSETCELVGWRCYPCQDLARARAFDGLTSAPGEEAPTHVSTQCR